MRLKVILVTSQLKIKLWEQEEIKYHLSDHKKYVREKIESYISICNVIEATEHRLEFQELQLKNISDPLQKLMETNRLSVGEYELLATKMIPVFKEIKSVMIQNLIQIEYKYRVIVILLLYYKRSRSFVCDLFTGFPSIRQERIDGIVKNKHLKILLNDEEALKEIELTLRTQDKYFKKGIEDFKAVFMYVDEFYPHLMFEIEKYRLEKKNSVS